MKRKSVNNESSVVNSEKKQCIQSVPLHGVHSTRFQKPNFG